MSPLCRSSLAALIALAFTATHAKAQEAPPAGTPPPAVAADAAAPEAPTDAEELGPPTSSSAAPASAAPAAPLAAAPRAPVTQPRYQASYERPPYSYVPTSARDRRIIGYREIRRNPPEIWGTGLGLLLGGFVLDFAVLTPIANAISNDRDGADEEDAWAWSLIPIAGPIIQLGVGAPHPAIPIATGLMQVGGLIMFILGLTNEETASIPVYQGSEHDPNMLRIGLDAAQVDGGAELRVTMTHL